VRRFFRSAAFPILIVVVLAFFAQRLISPGSGQETPDYNTFVQRVENNQIESVTWNTKDNTLNVKQTDGTSYDEAYPDSDAAQAQLLNNLQQQGRLEPAVAAHLHPALPPLLRFLDLPDEPDAGRRLARDELRQVARQANVGRRAEDHVP
jgi:ATP-dependent Zn protease